ncbi:MAG: NAD(P)/FAD-dependent oxidoreductase, partial [Actinomycetota bacterium]|nr:NAD(P)/FAD-dependent oxidoreductase [Actinomycetota bacterium]
LYSGFYPLAVASPRMAAMELEKWGLEWLSTPAVVVHQHSDGRTVGLYEDLDRTCESVEKFAPGDGERWRRLYEDWHEVQPALIDALFAPFPPVRPAVRMLATLKTDLLRFARMGLVPVRRFSAERFQGEGGGWLLAGNALHADLTPDMAGSALFGMVLCGLGQSVGFPFPRGGSGRITDALVRRFEANGGEIRCDALVEGIELDSGRATGVRLAGGATIEADRAVVADVIASRLYQDMLPADALPEPMAEDLENFQLDHSTFKVNWALDGPIPWTSEESRRAATIHLADGIDELSDTTAELARHQIPAKPFLILGQYSAADPSRAPDGCESAWAYTHVPQQIEGDAGGDLTGDWARDREAFADRMEERIEAVAPGFRELIRGRHIQSPADLEAANPNLVGGAINAGTAQIHQQLVFRPTPGWAGPGTAVRDLYLASASAHPGGGVHGGPGANAAEAAIKARRRPARMALAGAAALSATVLAASMRRRSRSG